MKFWNRCVTNLWNVDGVLQLPCCITLLVNIPTIVVNVVFQMSPGSTQISSYAFEISHFKRYWAFATAWWIASWSGIGVRSLWVLRFCSRRSNTIRNSFGFLVLFGIHIIGVAHDAVIGIHHPALIYCSIFAIKAGLNVSGHFGCLRWHIFVSSINGIWWLIFLSCGSLSG